MKVLIVRLGALGDIVHAIPVAAAIRRGFPNARIDWLVSVKHREILDLVPVINRRLLVIDRRSAGASRSAGVDRTESRGMSLWATIRELRRARYDVAIDLQGLIKSAAIARASGAPRVIGFVSRYLREPLARVFYTEAHDPGGAGIYALSETRHVVDINLGLLSALGVTPGPAEFQLDVVESQAASEIAERTGGRYALLNPCAAWPNKRWSPDRFAIVAAAIRDRHDLRSVVLWGPGERDIAEAVVAAAAGAATLAPQTTVADVVALTRGAAILISGDTGPTHIAAAVGTPLVGIYGPTRPERNGPLDAADQVVSRAPMCQCHHLRRCRLAASCLMDIEAQEVVDAVERRLAGSAGTRRAGVGR